MECICRENWNGYTNGKVYGYKNVNNGGYVAVRNNEGEEVVWVKNKFDQVFIDVEELKYLHSLLEEE